MTKTTIEFLTAEQEALRAKWRSEYFQLGWSTAPSNREAAETAITALYKLLDKGGPKFLWFDSPSQAAACIMESTGEGVGGRVLSGTDGNLDAYWVSFYTFGRTLKKGMYTEKDDAHLMLWDALVRSTGPCYPYEKYCLMTERPVRACYDDRELLHSGDGPALAYKDGFSVWAINGVVLPDDIGEQIVMRPWEMTQQQIEAIESADVRTIMQDRWCHEAIDSAGDRVGAGGGRWMEVTGMTQIHADVYTAYGDISLMRALVRDRDGRKFLCCSDSSTDRVYFIRVADDSTTCEEGHKSINGGVADGDIVASS
jgi:hypothetical protein